MIHPLTSLRFLFAFLVFLNHSAFLFQAYPSELWPFNHVFSKGGAGVCFFFIFSGFILSKVYSNRLLTKTSSWHTFIIKRIARIYPIHIVALLLFLPYHFVTSMEGEQYVLSSDFLKSFMLNISLLQSFYPDKEIYFSFNAPSWSLSVTMFFYLAFPGLIYLASKSKRTYLWVLLIMICALAFSLSLATINENLGHYLFYINPVVRLLDFMAGIALYLIIKDYKNSASVLRGTLTELVAFGVLIASLWFHDYVNEAYRYSLYYWLPSMLIISTIYFQKGYLSKLLSKKWLVFLGNISLSFYLLHWVILNYISLINYKLKLTENGVVLFILSLSVILLCSSISYLFIERPFIERLNRVKKKPSDERVLI